MESLEIFIETDEIILLSPEEVRGMAAIPVDGSVLVGPIESVAVVTESEPSAAAGQDGLPLPNLAIQERFVESDVQINSPPVVLPSMLSESLVETTQQGFAVEVGPMDEPGSSGHATQVQHSGE